MKILLFEKLCLILHEEKNKNELEKKNIYFGMQKEIFFLLFLKNMIFSLGKKQEKKIDGVFFSSIFPPLSIYYFCFYYFSFFWFFSPVSNAKHIVRINATVFGLEENKIALFDKIEFYFYCIFVFVSVFYMQGRKEQLR